MLLFRNPPHMAHGRVNSFFTIRRINHIGVIRTPLRALILTLFATPRGIQYWLFPSRRLPGVERVLKSRNRFSDKTRVKTKNSSSVPMAWERCSRTRFRRLCFSNKDD